MVQTTKGTLAGISAILIWSFTATILDLTSSVNPFLFNAIQYFTGFCVLLIYWRIQKKVLTEVIKGITFKGGLFVLFGIGIHDLTWVLAIQNAPADEAALLIYQWPILLILFTCIAKKQSPSLLQTIGMLLGSVGILIVFLPEIITHKFQLQPGHVYALISALTWSIYSAFLIKKADHITDLLAVNFTFMSVVTFTLWFQTGQSFPDVYNMTIIVLASALSCMGYMLWNYSMEKGHKTFVSYFSFLTPALAVLFLMIFNRVHFQTNIIIALAIIVTGIFIANQKPSTEQS